MREEKDTADRLAAYSDAVFAVIVTIMVLELRAPDQRGFSALWHLWPTAVSYAVSYLFIAIIWTNHHHLMRFVGRPTLGLIWMNFVHLFMVSLLPFATAWVARTRFASPPVACYAGLFVCDFHDRHTGCIRRTTPRLRSDLRRADPPLAAGRPRQLAVTAYGVTRISVTIHKSMTTSPIGREQQTRTLPSAGLSSGSGP